MLSVLSILQLLSLVFFWSISSDVLVILTELKGIRMNIDDVKAKVTAQAGAIDSAVTLLNELHAAIVAAGTDPAKLQEVADAIDANTATLAAAVAANPLP